MLIYSIAVEGDLPQEINNGFVLQITGLALSSDDEIAGIANAMVGLRVEGKTIIRVTGINVVGEFRDIAIT